MRSEHHSRNNYMYLSLFFGKQRIVLIGMLLLSVALIGTPVQAERPPGTGKSAAIVDKNQPLPAAAPGVDTIPGHYIVVFKDDVFQNGVNTAGESPRRAAKHMAAQTGAAVRYIYSGGFKGFSAAMSSTAVRQLQANPAVAYIEPDQPVLTTKKGHQMLKLSATIITLMQPFQPLFQKSTWGKAQILLIGAILSTGQRIVTATLRAWVSALKPMRPA
jgi:hypothetical protein